MLASLTPFFIIICSFLSVNGQIHFYHTDHSTLNTSPAFYDCLYYTVLEDIINYKEETILDFKAPHQIIPYCVRPSVEWTSFNDKLPNTTNVTFDYLQRNRITSNDLLLWSAPIDLAEQYEEHLNNSTDESSSLLFYNCTWPWFGYRCQYSFDVNIRNFRSIVRSLFSTKLSRPFTFGVFIPTAYTNLSCYTYINCTHRSLVVCLDWREVCDGRIDCYDDGIDEKNCFQLEANQCEDNEFQCRNGMCIPISFFNDSPFNFDCMDGTDEGSYERMDTIIHQSSPCFADPAFRCEEFSYIGALPHLFCGDGQTQFGNPENYCRNGRHVLKSPNLQSYDQHKHLTYECWFVLYCAINGFGALDGNCSLFCKKTKDTCRFDIKNSCSSLLIVFPQTAIWDGHVRRMYLTNKTFSYKKRYPKYLTSDYLCYDEKRCPFISNYVRINGLTCLKTELIPVYLTYSETEFFRTCLTVDISGNRTNCRHSSHFHCPNTSKCISRQRLVDGKLDCYDAADETFNGSCQLTNKAYRFQCQSEDKCIPWNNVMDRIYDCKDREDESASAIKRNIFSFGILCDGYQHLNPLLIESINETDETNCEEWPCNNIYTRCDGGWSCLNGEDELGCEAHSTTFTDCPINYHSCLSPSNLTVICLPFSQLNDTIIDCLGATDEISHCRQKSMATGDSKALYRCWNDTSCSWADAESIRETCFFDKILLQADTPYYMDTVMSLISFNIHALRQRQAFKYLSVLSSNQYPPLILSPLSTLSMAKIYQSIDDGKLERDFSLKEAWHCNRGLTIRYGSVSKVRCLCPPSYYGQRCQYQNQRVSLTLQFQPVCSPDCQGLFGVLVSLLDEKGIIHSQQVLSYIPQHHCNTKFNINLLYRNQPKDETISYSLRVEAYNKSNNPLSYYASWFLPIKFAFLPVNRVAGLLTFPLNPISEICPQFCGHGRCISYTNEKHLHYCRCDTGWSGIDCTIPYSCRCSSDALCVGIVNNRSSCICPVHKFGPRCMLPSICQSKPCRNSGLCIPDSVDPFQFTCSCQNKYTGPTCEHLLTEIVISFNKVEIPQSILLYLVNVEEYQLPTFIVQSTKISYDKDEAAVSTPQSFHIAFVQIQTEYYLVVLQENYTTSILIRTEVSPSRRCPPRREFVKNEWPLLRRVKSYHKICREHVELSCFHDEDNLMCLCTNERHANCFDFDFNQKSYECQSLHDCQNNASCYQDRPCPNSVMCICPECYYGSKCQLTTKGFGLNLDAILGYQIRPNVPFYRQPASVKFSLVMTISMSIIGITSGTISMMTFKSKHIQEVGCAFYLLASSIISVLLMIIFMLKCIFLLLTQMSLITNRRILWMNCLTMDYFLRCLLAMIDWLSTCVAVERSFNAIKGINFEKKKSVSISRWIILFVVILTFLSIIHDPIHRYLIDDTEDGRTWCIIQYSYYSLEIFNSVINILHFLIPFSLNILSAFILIIFISRNRSYARKQYNYKEHFREQCFQHKHLLISAVILILLSLPRLIISFISGCMKSVRDPWLFLIGYFISFIPSLSHIIVFILPSELYRNELIDVIRRIRHRLLCRK